MMITNRYIVCNDRSIYGIISNQFKNYRFRNVILNMSWFKNCFLNRYFSGQIIGFSKYKLHGIIIFKPVWFRFVDVG
jgi:hypothetical protein